MYLARLRRPDKANCNAQERTSTALLMVTSCITELLPSSEFFVKRQAELSPSFGFPPNFNAVCKI